jgi:hypothetical protein
VRLSNQNTTLHLPSFSMACSSSASGRVCCPDFGCCQVTVEHRKELPGNVRSYKIQISRVKRRTLRGVCNRPISNMKAKLKDVIALWGDHVVRRAGVFITEVENLSGVTFPRPTLSKLKPHYCRQIPKLYIFFLLLF